MGAEAAWLNVNEGLNGSEPWWARIVEAYGSEGRRYHDLAHLERKLALLQELGGASDRRALTFALFFQ